MGKQIILCVETNKQADTDSTYIMDAIRHNYVIDNSVKISKIYMKTKTRYKTNFNFEFIRFTSSAARSPAGGFYVPLAILARAKRLLQTSEALLIFSQASSEPL